MTTQRQVRFRVPCSGMGRPLDADDEGQKVVMNTFMTVDINAKLREEASLNAKLETSEHSTLFGSRALLTFVQPTERLKITYREQQSRLRRAVARHKELQDGCLLDTFEKGVAYPVVHVNFKPLPRSSTFPPIPQQQCHGTSSQIGSHLKQQQQRRSRGSTSDSGIQSDAKLSSEAKVQKRQSEGSRSRDRERSKATSLSEVEEEEELRKERQVRQFQKDKQRNARSRSKGALRMLKEDALGPAFHVQQGLYEEVKRIEPDFAFGPRDNIDHRAFILLGFKTLDRGFNSVLEQTWRDWTGARAIYLKMHNEFDLAKIVFYHRVQPENNLDLFTYLVLVECWNVTPSNLIRALDFVQRMRVERLNGYISLYRDLGLEEGDSNYHSGSQESLVRDDDDDAFEEEEDDDEIQVDAVQREPMPRSFKSKLAEEKRYTDRKGKSDRTSPPVETARVAPPQPGRTRTEVIERTEESEEILVEEKTTLKTSTKVTSNDEDPLEAAEEELEEEVYTVETTTTRLKVATIE